MVGRNRLVPLVRSHDNEKARWALAYCGVALAGTLAATTARAQIPPDPTFFDPPRDPAPRDPAPPEPAPPPPPRAPDPPSARFGAQGVFVVSGATALGFSSTQYDGSDASSVGANFSPGVDYFLLQDFSIGLDATVAHSETKGYGADGSLVRTTTTTFSAGPRFGVNLPLGKVVSLFPRLTLGVESVHQKLELVSGKSISTAGSAIGTDKTTQAGPWVVLALPLLIHPVPHFFVGPGASVFHEFARAQEGPDIGGQRTTLAATLFLGGYWGGVPAPEAAPPEPVPADARPRRFGDIGQIVLSNDVGATVSWQTHAGTDATSTRVAFAPALDVFLLDHVLLGAFFSVSHLDSSGIDPNTHLKVAFSSSVVQFGPRVGVDFPLAPFMSFRPVGGISFGTGSVDETSGTNQNKYTHSAVTVSASFALLVHPAQHLFLGLAPGLGHDLTHTYSAAGQPENRASTVGASFVLGAWL